MVLDKYIETSKRVTAALTIIGVVAIILIKGAILVSIEEIANKFRD